MLFLRYCKRALRLCFEVPEYCLIDIIGAGLELRKKMLFFGYVVSVCCCSNTHNNNHVNRKFLLRHTTVTTSNKATMNIQTKKLTSDDSLQ